jgi:hypothetical protein
MYCGTFDVSVACNQEQHILFNEKRELLKRASKNTNFDTIKNIHLSAAESMSLYENKQIR